MKTEKQFGQAYMLLSGKAVLDIEEPCNTKGFSKKQWLKVET